VVRTGGRWKRACHTASTSPPAYRCVGGSAAIAGSHVGVIRITGWALDCFERGIAVAPRGAPRLRLRYIAARTHAGLGNTGATADVLAAARTDHEAMGSSRDELQDEVRGEFEFSDARAAACAAAAWLELREGDRAEEYAHMALDRYSELPEKTQPFSPVNGIRIDIASARLLS
jgi:hypothetical protein